MVPGYVQTLQGLRIIRREVPFTEPPEKSRKGIYRIADPFVAFWARFILPHQSMIQAGQGRAVWDEFIQPTLDTHLGGAFEEVCRHYVLHRWSPRHGPVPRRVGSLHGADFDFDVLAEFGRGRDRTILVGECKWWKSPIGPNVLDELRARVHHLPRQWQDHLQLAIFALSGSTEDLRARARKEGIVLVDGDEIVAGK